jgi:hypothetical protein
VTGRSNETRNHCRARCFECDFAFALAVQLSRQPQVNVTSAPAEQSRAIVESRPPGSTSPNASATPSLAGPYTPFESVYSARAGTFVANLRHVGCPEETIKDILLAEMNRRYRNEEERLRPKPADHVPWGWSSQTVEAKLLERRHQAALIAREKETILRDALGYEVHVPMPVYAMTASDRQCCRERQAPNRTKKRTRR